MDAKPKMILLDYGHTLIGEPAFNSRRGTEAVMHHAVKNPQGLSPEQVDKFFSELFFSVCGQVRKIGAELHNMQCQRFVYEYLQIKFDVPPCEIEQIFWDNDAPGSIMPYADRMLAYLYNNGIRTGVISNISFSGDALTARLQRLLPGSHFEFVIASSEYMIRKPSPMLFELALRKAGIEADRVWFCGDSPTADIMGAASAGIYPVWYEDLTMENAFREINSKEPVCGHLHIHDWRELINILENMEK